MVVFAANSGEKCGLGNLLVINILNVSVKSVYPSNLTIIFLPLFIYCFYKIGSNVESN